MSTVITAESIRQFVDSMKDLPERTYHKTYIPAGLFHDAREIAYDKEAFDAKYEIYPFLPIRIVRRRRKGWRVPPDTVIVTRPGKWGNPYTEEHGRKFLDIEGINTATEGAVFAYEMALRYMTDGQRSDLLEPLKGKNLACWCELDKPCHADVLLRWANGDEG